MIYVSISQGFAIFVVTEAELDLRFSGLDEGMVGALGLGDIKGDVRGYKEADLGHEGVKKECGKSERL